MSIQESKLREIADAIREKDGTKEPIAANDFPARIRAIEAGGGSLPDNVRTITLSAEPPEGGTVSGGGVASDAMMVTVSAEANGDSNYVFDGWKENGAIVGNDPLYTFLVSADHSLVAVFTETKYIAGVDWWETELPASANWFSITYGNGKFVAVASSNRAAYSTDGITWTAATLQANVNWYSVTYGNGKFVAVAYNSNRAAYSTDGITWTAATLPASASWYFVAYGNGKFVAVTYNNNKAAYSADGITWIAATLPASVNWRSVTYGNGKFVAVSGDASNKAAYSTDGITWTAATLPASANWYSVAYGNGKFVAVSFGSKIVVYSSAKGPGA